MGVKPAAFAGSWYPGTGNACKKAITEFLNSGEISSGSIGGIVPHAGWSYSGSIACRVIASLVPQDSSIPDTIVLFGAHMHPFSTPVVLESGAVETPLGEIQVDEPLTRLMVERVLHSKNEMHSLPPSQFPDENTLELQYPFIRHFFPDSKIVVCGVPPSKLAFLIGETAVTCATDLGRTIRIIGSTDMTHYGPNFGFEPVGTGESAVEWVKTENDAQAILAFEDMDMAAIITQGLSNRNMCCAGAAAAAVAACKKRGAVKGVCLEYASSYDISRGSNFVGYCGMTFA